MARVESVLAELTALSTPAAQSLIEELLSTVLELHGTGLRRFLDVLEDAPDADALLARLDGDAVVRSLLLLHGLHPRPLRQRVETALETVRPFMTAHKGGVELLSVEGDTVRLRLQGTCNGCSASTQTMQNAVEKAIYEAAPDVIAIEVEGLAPSPAGPPKIECLKPLPLVAVAAPRRPELRSASEHPSLASRPVIR
ncbi:MAG: NifU family protein [Candidatus Dormibacteria bacterium]